MEEKKTVTISITGLLLFIAIIIICMMGIAIFSLSKNNTELLENANNFNSETTAYTNTIKETVSENSTEDEKITPSAEKDLSHEEIMNALYLPDIITIDNINYSKNELLGESDIFSLSLNENRPHLLLHSKDWAHSDNTSTYITGISGDIVDVIDIWDGVVLDGFAFLTRDGNVYYLDLENAVSTNDFSAKKVSGISEIIKLSSFGSGDGDYYFDEIIAIKADGSYEKLSDHM